MRPLWILLVLATASLLCGCEALGVFAEGMVEGAAESAGPAALDQAIIEAEGGDGNWSAVLGAAVVGGVWGGLRALKWYRGKPSE